MRFNGRDIKYPFFLQFVGLDRRCLVYTPFFS